MHALQTLRPGTLVTLLARLASPMPAKHVPAMTPLALGRAATRWLRRPRGWVVDCEAGTLWLTHDGEPRDIVLEAGQSHRCDHDGRLAIHALDDARLRLRPPGRRG